MKFKSLYFFIPCIGLGSLAFIGLIAYQSIDSFTASKQQELLKDIALQITANTPNKNAREADWISWVNKDRLIITSRLSIILQHTDGEIIALHGGHEPQLDTSQAKALISALTKKDPQDKYVIDNNLKHISHTSKIADTPYSLLLTHTSAKEDNSFYFKRLGMPVLIASVIVLWVSIWLAIILTNLYRRLDNQKQLIEHDSLHDPLTGLANRVLLTNRINQAINEAKHDNNQLAICMLDLDRFKEINDALGHEYGDKLLIEVATRIKSIVRDIDTVARIGGDEFAILLRHTDTETTRNIAERISTSLKSEFIIDDERFHISGSLGISFYPEHGTQPEILMKHADLTMYHVKNNNYEYAIYSPEQENTRKNTLFLYSDLVEAINNNQFEIHYQPKLNIKQNSIEGIEALLRWNHPKRGIIPPDDFIPLAEQTGLVRKISRWVLKRAIKDQLILKNYDIDLSIAVNLSAHDLADNDTYDYITSLTKNDSSIASAIVLEITESAMMFEPSSIDKILCKLNSNGFIISIDDFGTGYSSLRNLQRMHVREIKIDRSFVTDMDINENNARIVKGTIGLAHDLDIKVVAEGVESDSVTKTLINLGCDMIQGYSICPPLSLDKLIAKYWKASA